MLRQERRQARAQLAQATVRANRSGDPADEARVDSLRAEVRTLALEDHIKAVVDDWPPLTTEQRDRLAILLRGESVA